MQSSSKRFWIVTLPAGVLASGLLVVLAGLVAQRLLGAPAAPSRAAAPSAAAEARASEDLAALRSELERLRADLRAVSERAPAASPPSAVAAAASAQVAPQSAAPEALESAPGPGREGSEPSFASQLEERFHRERRDDGWSASAEDSLYRRFEDTAVEGGDLVAAECQSSVCRLEFGFDSAESLDQGLSQLTLDLPWDTDGMLVVDPQDPHAVVMLLTREPAASRLRGEQGAPIRDARGPR